MGHTALSLFCGAGGCSLGFQRAGYEILFASDIDKAAIDTYKANFPATSAVSRFNLRVKRGELTASIINPHLPINPTLSSVDIS